MSVATCNLQHDCIPCPYIEGATSTLEITPSHAPPVLEIRVRVAKPFQPFTISPVMRVTLEEVISPPPHTTPAQFGLPVDAVLKVYDHRFALLARKTWKLSPFTPEYEAEYMAYANGPHAARTLAEMMDDGNNAEIGDDHPEHLVHEHYVALSIASGFTSECNAYERLSELQGKDIPIFYGAVRFLGGEAAPNLDVTKPGILLEYVEGTDLESVDPEQVNIDFLARECLRIIETYSQLGMLNFDVRLGNFIVRPGGSGVVMIDFANSELCEVGMSDSRWKRDKWMQDEEGSFGESARRKWGWNFVHSYRWKVKI